MRLRRLTWALARLLIIAPITLLGLLALLLGLGLSPWGTSFLFNQGQRLGLFEVGEVKGSPLETLVLNDFHLSAGPVAVDLDYLELAWADDCLLQGKVCIDRLAAKGADIRLGSSEESTEPEQKSAMSDITLPFPVALREIVADDIDILLADGTRIYWASFSSGVTAQQQQVDLLPTRLAGLITRLPLSAGQQLALSDAEHEGTALSAQAIDAAIAVESPLPAAIAAEAEGLQQLDLADKPRIQLPEINLPLTVNIPSLLVENAELQGGSEHSRLYGVERLELAVSASGQTITIKPLTIVSREADARLAGNITLSGNYPLEFSLSSQLFLPERFPALNGEDVSLELSGDLSDLAVKLAMNGPAQARLDATLDALAPTLPFHAQLESPGLQWPLPGMEEATNNSAEHQAAESQRAEPWEARDVRLTAEGSLLDYSLQLALAAQGPSLPLTQLDLTGNGDLEHFNWAPLNVRIAEGSLASSGRVGWAEALDVSASLTLDNINPEAFVEGLEGRLNGQAEVSFHQGDDGWGVTVPGISVDGTLASYPLSLSAKLAGDSRMNWQIDTLNFYQGKNHLSASGKVSPELMDIAANIDMPALNTLYPELAGTLKGSIKAAGSLETPQMNIDIAGQQLIFADNQIASLTVEGQVAGVKDPEIDLALLAENVFAGGQSIDSVQVALDGLLSNHRLEIDLDGQSDGPLTRLDVVLESGLDQQAQHYAGQLERLDAQTPYGSFALSNALVFDADLAKSSAELQPFCIQREQGGAICLIDPLLASADAGNANLEIRELPMDLADAALPPGWSVTGTTEGTIQAQWSAGAARWQANVTLDSNAEITGEDAYGQPWTVPGSALTVQLDADQEKINSTVALNLGDTGDLRVELAIADPMGKGALEGRLTIDDIQLKPYAPLAGGVDALGGNLAGVVSISGDRNNPVMQGNIGLTELEASGLDLPLEIKDGQLDVALNGDRARINGFIASETGRLNVTGNASWPSVDQWQVAAALEARDEPLQASLPAFGKLQLAPDLTIRATPARLTVRGEVHIPWSRLEIGSIPPSAVSPSSDEVIITEQEDREERLRQELVARGETTAEAVRKAGMVTDIQVSLTLGPDMRLSAYGLKTKLVGKLDVSQKNGPLQLFGDVTLKDGRFQAFGQDLVIREGVLYFSGPPAEPLLDFEAIRNPSSTADNVIAGLRVTGLASNPSLQIFSEPALDEASALSYLLQGRGPSEGGGASDALTSALLGMTLGKAGGAVGAIGEAFGIQDLSLDTSGSGDDSQVEVSGNLTDRLSMSYGVGIFSPIARLTLRYKILNNLYVEAVSGVAQAVDLIYTFSLPGNPPKIQPTRALK
ncbi:translocation/assembly module TamB domain-containing protein [Halomonas halocynthiae]|uniref:autotransporter assembly complex protein TamB n=1 Tax=Halomonas halocynthiae TaxID=176290 RepID=UPI000485DE7A|nr:translocation/assembly module TamB domain-containing protein [Halomonas halocynthiae]